MKLFNVIQFFLLVSICISCQSYKSYYFTSFKSDNPRIYEYTCKSDKSKSQYWKMTTKGDELTTEAFDASFLQFESFTEEITGEGMRLKTYLSIDSKGDSLYHEIKNKDVFKWKENGPYEYSTKYEHGSGVVFFTKQRQYLDTPMIHVLGRDYEAISFKGIYQFSREEESIEYEYFQYSYYVKGIGMVKYERHYPGGEVLTLELTRIYTEEEWKELSK